MTNGFSLDNQSLPGGNTWSVACHSYGVVNKSKRFGKWDFRVNISDCSLEEDVIKCILKSILAVNKDLVLRITFLKTCKQAKTFSFTSFIHSQVLS